jgi:hypothetical protein
LGFVKEAEMRTPRNIADEIFAWIPPRNGHGRWLPISSLQHKRGAAALAADKEGKSRRKESAAATACVETSTGPMV